MPMLAHAASRADAHAETPDSSDSERGRLDLAFHCTVTCWHATYEGQKQRLVLGTLTDWGTAGAWTPRGPAGLIPVSEDRVIPRLRLPLECGVIVRRDGPTLSFTVRDGRTPADVLPRLLAELCGRGLIAGWGSSDPADPPGVPRMRVALMQRGAMAHAQATGGRPDELTGRAMADRLIAEGRARMTATLAITIGGRRYRSQRRRLTSLPATPDHYAEAVARAGTRLQTVLRDCADIVGTGSERTRRRRAAAVVSDGFWPENAAQYRENGSGQRFPAKMDISASPARCTATPRAGDLCGPPAVPVSARPTEADGGGPPAPDRSNSPAKQPAGPVRSREDARRARTPVAADRARTGGTPTEVAGDTADTCSGQGDATASVTAREDNVVPISPRLFKSMRYRREVRASDSYLFRQHRQVRRRTGLRATPTLMRSAEPEPAWANLPEARRTRSPNPAFTETAALPQGLQGRGQSGSSGSSSTAAAVH